MLNLHQMVRSAIASVHPDENVLLIQSKGTHNVRAEIVPVFEDAVMVKAQIQPLSSNETQTMEGTSRSKQQAKLYLFSDTPAGRIPQNLVRPLATSGDIVRLADNTWWLVTSMIEDFSRSGWVCVGATMQEDVPEDAWARADAWDKAQESLLKAKNQIGFKTGVYK